MPNQEIFTWLPAEILRVMSNIAERWGEKRDASYTFPLTIDEVHQMHQSWAWWDDNYPEMLKNAVIHTSSSQVCRLRKASISTIVASAGVSLGSGLVPDGKGADDELAAAMRDGPAATKAASAGGNAAPAATAALTAARAFLAASG